jgi:hypothetical protein
MAVSPFSFGTSTNASLLPLGMNTEKGWNSAKACLSSSSVTEPAKFETKILQILESKTQKKRIRLRRIRHFGYLFHFCLPKGNPKVLDERIRSWSGNDVHLWYREFDRFPSGLKLGLKSFDISLQGINFLDEILP